MNGEPATSECLPDSAAAPADPMTLRRAFGHFATGVAVVTARADGGRRLGITINSLSSLSLEPALLLWSLRCSSRDHAAFTTQARHFAVHVLGLHQQELCQRFQHRDQDRFAGLQPGENAFGVPLLDDCLVRFECRLQHCLEAGDHSILIGRIQALEENPGEPLLFHRGRFGHFGRPP